MMSLFLGEASRVSGWRRARVRERERESCSGQSAPDWPIRGESGRPAAMAFGRQTGSPAKGREAKEPEESRSVGPAGRL